MSEKTSLSSEVRLDHDYSYEILSTSLRGWAFNSKETKVQPPQRVAVSSCKFSSESGDGRNSRPGLPG